MTTPNFRRLAERATTFDHAFAGSMPGMPARRELHTGRCNFLHQMHPIENVEIENLMARLMAGCMRVNDAPPEQFVRMGLEAYR